MKRRISAGVLATVASLAATLGLGAVPASAAPAAPALSSPAQSATATTNPVFSWNRVAGAARYSVQVATQSDFASGTVKFSLSTANTYATPLTTLPRGSTGGASPPSTPPTSRVPTRPRGPSPRPQPMRPSPARLSTGPRSPTRRSRSSCPGTPCPAPRRTRCRSTTTPPSSVPPTPSPPPTTATRRPCLPSAPRPTGACGPSRLERSALAVLGAPVVHDGVERDRLQRPGHPVAREHHRLHRRGGRPRLGPAAGRQRLRAPDQP